MKRFVRKVLCVLLVVNLIIPVAAVVQIVRGIIWPLVKIREFLTNLSWPKSLSTWVYYSWTTPEREREEMEAAIKESFNRRMSQVRFVDKNGNDTPNPYTSKSKHSNF